MRRWYVALALVCVGWGSIPLVARESGLPAGAIAFSRVALAAVAFGGVIAARRRRSTDSVRLFSYRPAVCVAAGMILGVHWLCLFAAYERAPVSTVILITYLAPVAVAVVAPFALKERFEARTALALAAGLAGFVLVYLPGVEGVGKGGLMLSLAAMATWAAMILISKPLAETYGALRLVFIEMAVASVVLLPVAASARWGSPRLAWTWLLVLGLVHTALGWAIYMSGLERISATHVGILGYLEPVSAVALTTLVLGTQLAAGTIIGGVLVIASGVLLVARRAEVASAPR